MNITIELSQSTIREIKKFLYAKKLTGNLMPDIDPIDWLALEVIRKSMEQLPSPTHVDTAPES